MNIPNWLIAKWLCLSAVNIVLGILGLFVVPVALLSAGATGRLPRWAWLWDNDREPFGDTARLAEFRAASSRLKKLYLRFVWLALRNHTNNAGFYFGVPQDPNMVWIYDGDPRTSDQGHPGELWVYGIKDGWMVCFEYYAVKAYTATRCTRLRIGWKLAQNVRDDGTPPINDGSLAELVHTYNPVDTFTHEAE